MQIIIVGTGESYDSTELEIYMNKKSIKITLSKQSRGFYLNSIRSYWRYKFFHFVLRNSCPETTAVSVQLLTSFLWTQVLQSENQLPRKGETGARHDSGPLQLRRQDTTLRRQRHRWASSASAWLSDIVALIVVDNATTIRNNTVILILPND